MRDVGITLSDSVVKTLTDYGEARGWSLEEAIRYIIGEYVGSHPFFNFPTKLKPIPTGGSMSFSASAPNPFNALPTAEGVEKMMRQLSWLVASSGMAKCKECLQPLGAEDIMAGKCSKCGTAL